MTRQIKQADGSVVYPIYNNMVDVFTGEGWKNRSRYLNVKGKGWVHIAGTNLGDRINTMSLPKNG